MPKWEYLNYWSLESPSNKQLNKFGEGGWKLVSYRYDKDECEYHCLFMRPKNNKD